jgi:hypothetical protein
MKNVSLPQPRLSITFWGACGAFVYALLTTFLLQLVTSAVWLGGVFFPVVLISPIIIVLMRRRSSIQNVVGYTLVGILGVYLGYALSALVTLQPPYRSFFWLSIPELVLYDIPALALVLTIVALLANVHEPGPFRIRSKTFSPAGAWLSILAAGLVAAGYMFGAGTHSCGSPMWGYYEVMLWPLVFFVRPASLAVPVAAFIVGGLLPRYISFNQRITACIVALCVLAACLIGFIATAPSPQPCQAH